jgi:hypothetical protein
MMTQGIIAITAPTNWDTVVDLAVGVAPFPTESGRRTWHS